MEDNVVWTLSTQEHPCLEAPKSIFILILGQHKQRILLSSNPLNS